MHHEMVMIIVLAEHSLCSFFPSAVLPGPGAAGGAGDHGARKAGECSSHLSPSCHALPPCLLPRQECW